MVTGRDPWSLLLNIIAGIRLIYLHMYMYDVYKKMFVIVQFVYVQYYYDSVIIMIFYIDDPLSPFLCLHYRNHSVCKNKVILILFF